MSNANAGRYDVSAISCGREQTLALLSNGKVIGWGSEGSGRVPSGEPEYCTTPAPTRAVEVISRDPMRAVAAGHGVSLGVDARRQVTAWGGSGAGVDGRAGAVAAAIPMAVAGVSAARRVAAGEFQCAAVDEQGALYTWGLALDGALGRDAATFESPAARVPGIPAVRDVAIGMGYMLALTQDRTVYAWGGNAAGQLGVGHLRTVEAPARIAIPHRVQAIAAGASHALALSTDGRVLAWGSNNHGQLGLGQGAPAYATTPAEVSLHERAQAVAAGMYFSLALGTSGRVYAWGWNHHGQVGTGDEDDRRAPVAVDGIEHVRRIAAGQAHVAVLAADGLYGWGSNAAGQIGGAAKEQREPHLLLATREVATHG
ncbi:MAG: hypothetical protein U1F54_20940 [Burkholderiales bacterium]